VKSITSPIKPKEGGTGTPRKKLITMLQNKTGENKYNPRISNIERVPNLS